MPESTFHFPEARTPMRPARLSCDDDEVYRDCPHCHEFKLRHAMGLHDEQVYYVLSWRLIAVSHGRMNKFITMMATLP